MSWPVRLRRRAELDLRLAARWYEAQRTGLRIEFIDELQRLVATLADNALLYADRFNGIRRAPARRFPYAVYFKIHGEHVVVLRVLHMRREQPVP